MAVPICLAYLDNQLGTVPIFSIRLHKGHLFPVVSFVIYGSNIFNVTVCACKKCNYHVCFTFNFCSSYYWYFSLSFVVPNTKIHKFCVSIFVFFKFIFDTHKSDKYI